MGGKDISVWLRVCVYVCVVRVSVCVCVFVGVLSVGEWVCVGVLVCVWSAQRDRILPATGT